MVVFNPCIRLGFLEGISLSFLPKEKLKTITTANFHKGDKAKINKLD